MLIISRTPVRISFFGGGTDYPDYFAQAEGAVLGTTIDQYTYISVKTVESNFFEHNIRIAYSRTELVKAIEEIQHPSIREALRHHGIGGNLDIHIFSDLPARTGLGSSSSFTVGFVNALYALEGKRRSKQALAEEACWIEQKMIEENVGSQDQFHAAFGGLNLITFSSGSIQVKPVCLTAEKRRALQDHLLIFFTGRTRHASAVVQEQIEKTRSGVNTDYLKKMHHLVYEAERALIEASHEEVGALFGRLLDEGWQIKRQLSSQITNPQIDAAYNAALKAGAYGGKLCGAGNGGFLLFAVPPEKQPAVRAALALEEVRFRFEDEGSTIVYMKD